MQTTAIWQCCVITARTCIPNINKYTTITFPNFLYGCDIWCLTFRGTDTEGSTIGQQEPNISMAAIDSIILLSQSTVQNIRSWYSVTTYPLPGTPRCRFRDNTETDLEQTLRVGFSWLIAGWTHEESSVVVGDSVSVNTSRLQVLLYNDYSHWLRHIVLWDMSSSDYTVEHVRAPQSWIMDGKGYGRIRSWRTLCSNPGKPGIPLEENRAPWNPAMTKHSTRLPERPCAASVPPAGRSLSARHHGGPWCQHNRFDLFIMGLSYIICL